MRQILHFATFWAGDAPSPYEAACLGSFIKQGYDLTVYSYDSTMAGLPTGVKLAPAQAIVEQRFQNAFLIKGKPSLSNFSDLFRYRMFQRTDAIWVDSDMFLLRPFDAPLPATIIAREDDDLLCGAIMRLSRDELDLDKFVRASEANSGRTIAWGENGPRLLTRHLDMATALPPHSFFPIHFNEVWKLFLPEYHDECATKCQLAYTLHLYNNILTKMGVWKAVLPPDGSFLGNLFVSYGFNNGFAATMSAPVMRHVIDNYRMRMNGNLNDVTRLARMVGPGLRRRSSRHLHWLRERIGS